MADTHQERLKTLVGLIREAGADQRRAKQDPTTSEEHQPLPRQRRPLG